MRLGRAVFGRRVFPRKTRVCPDSGALLAPDRRPSPACPHVAMCQLPDSSTRANMLAFTASTSRWRTTMKKKRKGRQKRPQKKVPKKKIIKRRRGREGEAEERRKRRDPPVRGGQLRKRRSSLLPRRRPARSTSLRSRRGSKNLLLTERGEERLPTISERRRRWIISPVPSLSRSGS